MVDPGVEWTENQKLKTLFVDIFGRWIVQMTFFPMLDHALQKKWHLFIRFAGGVLVTFARTVLVWSHPVWGAKERTPSLPLPFR